MTLLPAAWALKQLSSNYCNRVRQPARRLGLESRS